MSAHAHEHGSLADEAVRLAEAFGQMASTWSRGAGPATSGEPTPEGAVPASCRVCPLCQVIARVQEVRPEVVAHLADATSSLAAALSELAGSREQGRPAQPTRDDIEHIDISD